MWSGASEKDHEHVIAITSGSSRDHREDLTQWMLALATTHQGDSPLCVQPLSGNTSDTKSLVKSMTDRPTQRKQTDPQEKPIDVADSGLSSPANMQTRNHATIDWASRVPETRKEAKAAVTQDEDGWQTSTDGTRSMGALQMVLPQAHVLRNEVTANKQRKGK